ncbi:MAG: ABC transporter ATP-binding protein [Bacillota bacterium]
MGKKVVWVRNVGKAYNLKDVRIKALDGISMHVGKGEFVVLMGPSGSGKSTLLNMIGTIDYPTTGEIVLFEKFNPQSMTEEERAFLRLTRIGFVYQAFHLVPFLNVLENTALPIRISNLFDKEQLRTKVLTMIANVGLEDRVYHRPFQLSFGERQRVAIARSLINNPELVLADEPTGNLDVSTSQDIIKLMKELSIKKEVSFFIATHDESIIWAADRVLHLKDGRMQNI